MVHSNRWVGPDTYTTTRVRLVLFTNDHGVAIIFGSSMCVFASLSVHSKSHTGILLLNVLEGIFFYQ